MTELHASLELLEGELPGALAGAAAGHARRSFALLRLMRSDGTTGAGEASPLPGYSPESMKEALGDLQHLIDGPVEVDPLTTPYELLGTTLRAHEMQHPSSRFALETALLDWLSHNRGEPLHETLGGDADRQPIPIADLVTEADPASWPAQVDARVADGATHVKLKIGADLDAEMAALESIRAAHADLPLRLDANRRMPLDVLQKHAASLEALRLDFIEEPVAPEHWHAALALPLPFALDETLRDLSLADELLNEGRISAVVLKPTVLGGLRASFEMAERAAAHGVRSLVSHTFDGPVARAATAELALALQTELAAGLGGHAALELWPPHRTAAIRGRQIVPHGEPGLGLHFEENGDA